MLPESRIYTCVDLPRQYAPHLLEEKKLVQDMALIHHLHGEGFAFFRDVCLNIHPILSLLNSGECFGFYLESEKIHDESLFRLIE